LLAVVRAAASLESIRGTAPQRGQSDRRENRTLQSRQTAVRSSRIRGQARYHAACAHIGSGGALAHGREPVGHLIQGGGPAGEASEFERL